MHEVYERCCGIDVHKRQIVACFRCTNKKEVTRQFGTTTAELRKLTAWLLQENCQMIAMESTASYWKPLYNIFEISELDAMIVNAQHIKNVPGRKTDVKDAQWIADLLQHGLLNASYIPDREQRELREVSRYRRSLINERARELNRLQKVLEGANIKLSDYTTVDTKSSRRVLDAIVAGESLGEEELKELLHGSMHKKIPSILEAIDGIVTSLQKDMLRAIINHIDDMSVRIAEVGELMKNYLTGYEDAIQKLDGIPGIGIQSAETILAEIGLDMSRFPSAKHLANWAGLAPGNNESAWKRKKGKTTRGNKTLKATLVQCATSAIRKKDNFFYAQYQRLVVRLGKNKAKVAVAHSMLIAIYHMLRNDEEYKDLGVNYYNQFNREKKINSYLKKLKELGWEEPSATEVAIG